jgi:hypothetical protein
MKKVLPLFATLAFVAGVGWTWWWLQTQQHERRLADCHSLRSAISNTRSQDFETSRRQMNKVRLNDSQADTLRSVDRAAYDRYVDAFSDRVNAVANAADKLGGLVDRYGSQGCFDLR